MPGSLPVPAPRGPLSAALIRDLLDDHPATPPRLRASTAAAAAHLVRTCTDPIADDDFQLSLWLCYELHYRGIEGVDDDWEWDPDLLAMRATLEDRLLRALRMDVRPLDDTSQPIDETLREVVAADDAPPLSRFLAREATLEQWREFVMMRSAYHLKEADPHTWALPRLGGRAKAAMVEIQADEYGSGQVQRMHCELFARVMRAFGLDDSYGIYVDRTPAVILAGTNVASMFGLHRRLRGAIVGHLAAFEMTSTEPNRRYGAGVRRLGLPSDAFVFYDEHVEADAVHEQIAAVDLCGSLVADDPSLRADVVFGAACALHLDARAARHQWDAWTVGKSALSSDARMLADYDVPAVIGQGSRRVASVPGSRRVRLSGAAVTGPPAREIQPVSDFRRRTA